MADIYKQALEFDGLESRLNSAAEEATEFAGAVIRAYNRPDRPESMDDVRREFLQLKMCMNSIEDALDIQSDMSFYEVNRFAEKLQQRIANAKK